MNKTSFQSIQHPTYDRYSMTVNRVNDKLKTLSYLILIIKLNISN